MRKSVVVVGAGILLALGWNARALPPAAPPPRPPSAVAVVNLGRLMDGLDEAKATMAQLKERRDAANRKLQELVDRMNKIDQDLELLQSKKDSPEYRSLAQEKFELTVTARARKEMLQQTLEEDQGAVTRAAFLKAVDAAKRYALAEGIDLVLRDDSELVPPERVPDRDGVLRPITGREVRSVTDQRSVLFASERIDITASLITAMNNEYSAGKR